MNYKHSRFETLDKPMSRIHRWRGHEQVKRASGPTVDGWTAFTIFCSCGIKFEVVR